MVDEIQSVPPTEPTADLPQMVVGEPMNPVAATERIHTLDVLRGFAIFGIFMVNIAFFSMPLMSIANPSLMADASSNDQLAHAIVRAFFEYKFVSLFSLLFGMGLAIQMIRAEKRGRPFVPLYLRRIFVLMLLGLAHALLLWYGDILFIYSIVALIALLMRKLTPRTLLIIFGGVILLSVTVGAGFLALGVYFGPQAQDNVQSQETTQVESSPSILSGKTNDLAAEVDQTTVDAVSDDRWERFTSTLKEATWQPGDAATSELSIIAYKEGPMLATLIMRAIVFGMMLIFIALTGFGFRVIGMFILGIALMKMQFFDRKRKKWHVMMCVGGLLLGIPGELWLVWSYHTDNYQVGWVQVGVETIHNLSSLALCLGYVGTITLIVQAGLLRWLTYAFSCVGRTALSNYLLQTIVATYIMYWWGLGMFNDVSRPQQLAIVVSVYSCQLVLSVLYLQVFSIGPFEWLWRSLTYLKLQPILRKKPAITS